MIKQKLTILSLCMLSIVLSGCQEAKAPAQNNNDSNSSITITPTSQDVNGNVTITPEKSQTPEVDPVAKTSVMVKMMEDGLEMLETEDTKNQGIMLMEKGLSLLKENVDTLSKAAEIKVQIEKMEKGLTMIKDEKTIKEGKETSLQAMEEIKKLMAN